MEQNPYKIYYKIKNYKESNDNNKFRCHSTVNIIATITANDIIEDSTIYI